MEETTFGDLPGDGRIILASVLNTLDMRVLDGFTWLRIGTIG
jgi:hypothetical protein